MEIVSYDDKNEVVTVSFQKRELLDAHAILTAYASTLSHQNMTIVGISKDRINAVWDAFGTVVKELGKIILANKK